MVTRHPSRCVREGEPILTDNFFLCAGMCRKLTFGNYLNYVAMRPARVGRGPATPTEWRARVVRVGGARGGPCGHVLIAVTAGRDARAGWNIVTILSQSQGGARARTACME